MKIKIFLTAAFACVLPYISVACSAFFHKGEKLVLARNLDWYSGEGYLIKNNRGIEKFAYQITQSRPAHWISKFGSITFNQIGKEFPYGGMNEKGLVVEQLWLHASTYQDNKNESISELEWIQYQLDNFESVPEVLTAVNTLSIKPIKATVHYFVADKQGNSASIDFVAGKIFINRQSNGIQVLTNSSYEISEEYYRKKMPSIDTSSRLSEDRYCQVSENLKKYDASNYDNAFKILSLSAEYHPNYKTFWSIVYDLGGLEVRYKTYASQEVKTLRLGDLNFNPDAPILACNLNATQLVLEPYSFEMNQTLLNTALKNMGINANATLAARHQFNPSSPTIDSAFIANHSTLKIYFHMKKKGGNLYYTIAQGETNFNRRRGSVSNMIAVDSTVVYSEAYAIVNGEYGLAAFHDVNGNKKLDLGWFGIPIEPYAFSGNKKGLFGLPPKYEKVKFGLKGNYDLIIKF